MECNPFYCQFTFATRQRRRHEIGALSNSNHSANNVPVYHRQVQFFLKFIIHSGFVVARTTLAEPTAFAACVQQLVARMGALSSATSVSGALVPFGRLKCKKLRLRHIAFLFIWPMPSTILRCFAQRKHINHYARSHVQRIDDKVICGRGGRRKTNVEKLWRNVWLWFASRAISAQYLHGIFCVLR